MGNELITDTVRTGEITMDYFRFGHGDKTLVIIPGASAVSVMKFADAVKEAYNIMADDYTVYVIDRRKNIPDVYSITDMARDTIAVIKAVGLDRFDLFGTSQGGMIALVMTLEHPEMIRRLALGSSSATLDGDQYPKAIGKWVTAALEGNVEEMCLEFGRSIYPTDVFEASKDALIESAKAITPEELKHFTTCIKAIDGFDLSDRLHEIKCPVIVLGSEDDQVLGAAASYKMAEQFKDNPGSSFHMYDGYGHAAYDFAPDYKERLLDFFNAQIRA